MLTTTLCFDFGNTRKKAAVFRDDELDKVFVLKDDSADSIRELINTYAPRKSILSSVVDHNPEMETLLAAHTKFHKLSHLTRLPFTTPVGKPETIGADRLALAAGAVHFYPGKNNLVIATGSCITYNFINKYKELVGGGISPGLEMRLKSLNHYTAKLPVVEAAADVPLIGYDTKTNIHSGVILGMAYEMDGFIDGYAEKFDNFNVVLTGGDIVYLASHLKNKIFADPDLIFKGLYAISEVNNP
ncbi:MAG TPA: type III pantothenate kinase [Chitinophagaceae bacterium]|nr:type III pantothenate kinase [Chitinophagaceae bacterium]